MDAQLNTNQNHIRGFTLIEIIVVMVLMGILAVIAIPKFSSLANNARITATQSALKIVRSAINLKYAENTTLPASITDSDFAAGGTPTNRLTSTKGIATVGSAPAGTATSGSAGFWYISSTGIAGAYSNGIEDTSTW